MAKIKSHWKRRERHKARQKSRQEGTIQWMPGDIPSVTEGKSPAMDFSDALMRGHPSAQRLLDEALKNNQPKEEASLADQFVAATYGIPKQMNLTAREAKNIEPFLQSYRNDMRKAHRFVLDDEFTRYATEVSSGTSASKLLARLQYATLPYETTWIEFNLKVKVRTMRRFHNLSDDDFDWDQVTDRLGLLLHRLDPTTAVVEIMTEAHGGLGLVSSMICYFFSTNEHEFKQGDGSKHGCTPMLPEDIMDEQVARDAGITKERFENMKADQRLMHLNAASLWGYTDKGDAGMLDSIRALKRLRLPSFLMRHGLMGWSRMYFVAVSLAKSRRVSGDGLAEVLAHETTEFAGMMRWVVCVLAMLNEVPISVDRIEPQGTIRTGLTSRRPLMEYHKVVLKVPKTDPVRYIQRKLAAGTRRRAHEVRTHWRNYLHETHCRYDEHVWITDHEEGYRLCERCEAYSRRIDEHIRGDASLGWVRKDYVIKKETE